MNKKYRRLGNIVAVSIPMVIIGATVQHVYAEEPQNSILTEQTSVETTMDQNTVEYSQSSTGTDQVPDKNTNGQKETITDPDKTNESITQEPDVIYETHVQNKGWQSPTSNGETSGTVGEGKRIEAIKIHVDSDITGGVEYQTHVQGIGWQDWVNDNQMAGTTGQSRRIEAIRIRLNGELASKYHIYYRTHIQNYGWLGWAKDGEYSGSQGYSLRMEALQIKLIEIAKESTDSGVAFQAPSIKYRTQLQGTGWQDYRTEGQVAGTIGQSRRMESVKIELINPELVGDILYQTHIQNYGWETNWAKNGELSGTVGQGLRLEAIRIKLDGAVANDYDIYYTVHAANIGWLGWAKNGENAGTSGASLRLEGLIIKLLKKGEIAPALMGTINTPFVSNQTIYYRAYVDGSGWQTNVKDGETAGTTGQSKQIDQIVVEQPDSNISGTVEYRGHIQNIGWQNNWTQAGNEMGQPGLRLEAIQMRLTGELTKVYDLYYRAHCELFGWEGWAKDGESAGSKGAGFRMEGLQVELRVKGSSAPGTRVSAYRDVTDMVSRAQGYTSATNRLILLDKTHYRVGVFERSNGQWKLVHECLCGIGAVETPTVEGQFKTGPYKNVVHRRPTYNYWYVTQFYGDYLFHSVLYTTTQNPVQIRDGRMGIQVSHGCVRLSLEDAKYIFYQVPLGTKVVIYH